jgi:HlyD family secretion protein
MSKTLKWILSIVIILGVIWFFISKKNGGSKTDKVAVEKAVKKTIVETVSTSGKIYPETEIRVSPDYSGQVTELRVAEGDTVRKGQVLARINDRTSIEASIDGVVLSLKVKKGESVTGNSFSIGTEIMTLADMSLLEIRADVGENDIVKVAVGDSADITVDAYNNRKFKGVVTKIANGTKGSANSFGTSGDITNYEVKIRIDSSSYRDLQTRSFPFRPGMNASVEISTKKVENVLSVPIAAVNARMKGTDMSLDEKKIQNKKDDGDDQTEEDKSKDQMEEVVFVLQSDGTVKKQLVKTGIQDINYIEVQQGLKEGEQVVIGPYSALSKTLRNGSKVKVVPKEKLFVN